MQTRDTKLIYNADKKYYDIEIDDDGNLANDNSYDNVILGSLFFDSRADSSQVTQAGRRRGWHINELNQDGHEHGSLLWLLEQRRLNQETVNDAIVYTQNALQWMINDRLMSNIDVDAQRVGSTLTITIEFTTINNVVFNRTFDLFTNTVPVEAGIIGAAS